MKIIKIIVITFIISNLAYGQKTILWKITDTVNNKESVILGTNHAIPGSFIDSIPEIKEYILSSDLAIFEAIYDSTFWDRTLNKRPVSKKVDRLFRRKYKMFLHDYFNSYNLDIYKLEPYDIEIFLSNFICRCKCFDKQDCDSLSFDKHLINFSKNNKIKVIGLEPDFFGQYYLEKQYGHINWNKSRRRIKKKIKIINDKKNADSYCDQQNRYLYFDVDYYLDEYCSRYKEHILNQRNANWMDTLPSLLRKNNCFIAVGWAHLRNQCGLIEKLKKKGFIVEPIELQYEHITDKKIPTELIITGKLKRFKKADIVISKNDCVYNTIQNTRRFKTNLPLNNQYTFDFIKKNHITKSVGINTVFPKHNLPAFSPFAFDFDITLKKEGTNSNADKNKKSALIYYDDKKDYFYYKRQ